MYIPISIYAHVIYTRGISRSIHRYWYAYFPLRTVFYCLTFSHLHRWQVFFWEADFELRLVWRGFIREGSGRGKGKEAGLGRGRSWSVMYSQQRPQLIPPQSSEAGMDPQSCPKMGRGHRPSYRQLIRHWMLADPEGSEPWVRSFSLAEEIPKEGGG